MNAILYTRRPAKQGWHWLGQAFGMFRRYWLLWLLLLIAYLVLSVFITAIPLVGPITATLLKPVFGVGFLAAAWSQERGEEPKLTQLFAGFRSNLYALLPLGCVYWLGMTLALLATALADQGVLVKFLFSGQTPPEDYWSGGDLENAMLVAILCALPVLLAMWFAPALVVFSDAGPLTALAVSLRAALSNWRALAVFSLTLLLLWGVLPGLLFGIFVAALDKNGIVLWIFASMPIWMSLLATLYISDYVSYRDVFHANERAG